MLDFIDFSNSFPVISEKCFPDFSISFPVSKKYFPDGPLILLHFFSFPEIISIFRKSTGKNCHNITKTLYKMISGNEPVDNFCNILKY